MRLSGRFKNFFADRNLILIILLSLLPFIFIFSTSSFFYTQDGWTHLARAAAFYKALGDGQIPVRWAGDLNYSYGMPLFDFAFHLPYILMSILIFLGFGLVGSLKIITLISFIASGIFMFLFGRIFFGDSKKAFLVTIFYQFFPFRFSEMFVRGSAGEMFTFAFLPMILYGSVLMFKKPTVKGIIIVSVGTFCMVLSHLATGSVFLIIAGFFVVLFAPKIKSSIFILSSMVLGLGLSAYYFIPALLDNKYTYGSMFARNLYAENFVPFLNFFIPNFLNSSALRTGNVPIQIGIFHSFAIIAAAIALILGKKLKTQDKKLILFCFIILGASLFIMQPVSKIIWQRFPLFDQFQFPWRFLAPVGFASSVLSVYLLNIPVFSKKNAYLIFLFLVIVTTAVYWYPQLGFRKVNEKDYWNYPLTTTYFGETDLIWSAGPATSYPQKRVEVIGGLALIDDVKETSNVHTYYVTARKPSVIVDHTQFFPGWRVFVDGHNTAIQFQDQSHRGEITFPVNRGSHSVVVRFSETSTRLVADIISVISAVFVLALLFLKKINKTVA